MVRTSNSTKELTQKRTKQLDQISEVISSLESSQLTNQAHHEKFEALDSVSVGIYDEIDKLTKKKPIEAATEIMVEEVNDIIRETQRLITEDPYIKRLKVFVPAGERPEVRDVLFVLRLVRQGMERFGKRLNQEKQEIDKLMLEAKVIKIALEIFQQNYLDDDDYLDDEDYLYDEDIQIKTEDIQRMSGLKVPDKWEVRGRHSNLIFNFEQLDYIEIEDYFKLS